MADYKKNFLSSVVVRIDFDKIDLSKINSYLKKIQGVFAKYEQQSSYESELTIDVEEGMPISKQVNNQLQSWMLLNDEETKRAQISQKWLWIDYRKYKNSKELLADVEKVIDAFIDHFGIESVNRVGMLYSNVVKTESNQKPTHWEDYINPKLLAGIHFADENAFSISRNMGQIVKHAATNDLRFDYGIWNRDFPNQVARKEFILQYDCYTNLAMDARDLKMSELIEDFNDQIESLFEASITDKLREIMRKG
ncbi:MAG TPA: TIGR04255 family protein [Candidatus Saccharimonadales bacterium]|nr:TIGR04255 family protein [Candidatus Saccharimonadales bacterium]